MKTAQDFAHIPGWGIDADPKNDPTYPMRHRTTDAHSDADYERPTRQADFPETLMSIERPSLPAVIGNSVAPSGLSGMIRRLAFKYSENHYGHWLPLLLADRINMIEGVVSDLAHGHIPNLIAEKGYKTEWKYGRARLITKLATTAAVIGGVVALVALSGKKNSRYRSGSRR